MANFFRQAGVMGTVLLFTLMGVGTAAVLDKLSTTLILAGLNVNAPILSTLTGIGGTMDTTHTENNGLITFPNPIYGGETLLMNVSENNRANTPLNGTLIIELKGSNVTGGELTDVFLRIKEGGVWGTWKDITDDFNTSPARYMTNISWNAKDTIDLEWSSKWSPTITNDSYSIDFSVIPN